MKFLFFFLFSFFILIKNSHIKSDEIDIYQIEGISINDSLLNIFTKKYISKKSKDVKLGKKKYSNYKKIYKDKNNKLYDRVVLYYKSGDLRYAIKKIIGRKYFKNKIEECYKSQQNISNDLEKSLINSEKIETDIIKNPSYPNGDSYYKVITFYMNENSSIWLICNDYSKKDTKTKDKLEVLFFSGEYYSWSRSAK